MVTHSLRRDLEPPNGGENSVTVSLSNIRAVREQASGLYPGISASGIDTGDLVSVTASSQSEPLFLLARVDPLRVIADIPESESSLIRDGQPATLTVDAFKGRLFTGRVRRSNGVLDPHTRTLRIEVELDTPAPDLRPGMFGSLTVTLVDQPRAIVLPTSSIGYEAGKPIVLCFENGTTSKRAVQIGYSDRNPTGITEILHGITTSDSVVAEFTYEHQRSGPASNNESSATGHTAPQKLVAAGGR